MGNLNDRGVSPTPKINEGALAAFHLDVIASIATIVLELPRDKECLVPRLSIIIPCLGGGAEFDGTLVSVLQHRPDDCEVLVVHSEPYDDPYKLRGEVHFIHSQAKSVCELLNQALDEAVGEVVHIVACGLEASEGWTSAALAHFDDPEVASVSPVILEGDRESLEGAGVHWSLGGVRRLVTDRRVLSPGSGRLRARVHGPTLSAAFYRRDVLVALGRFEADLGDELADVGMALDVQSLGRLHVCEPGSQLVQNHLLAIWKHTGFASGRAAERLFWRSALKRGLTLSLGLHLITLGFDIARQGVRLATLRSLAGRVVAWMEWGAATRHEQKLAAASQRLNELAELRSAIRKTSKSAHSKRRLAA